MRFFDDLACVGIVLRGTLRQGPLRSNSHEFPIHASVRFLNLLHSFSSSRIKAQQIAWLCQQQA